MTLDEAQKKIAQLEADLAAAVKRADAKFAPGGEKGEPGEEDEDEDKKKADKLAAELDAAKKMADEAKAGYDAAMEKIKQLEADMGLLAKKAKADALELFNAVALCRGVVSGYEPGEKSLREVRIDTLGGLGVKVKADDSDDYIRARLDAALEMRGPRTASHILANGLQAAADKARADSQSEKSGPSPIDQHQAWMLGRGKHPSAA